MRRATRSPRVRLWTLVLLLCSTSIGMPVRAASPTSPAQATPSTPNVLIVLTDDQRLAGMMEVLPHVRTWFGKHGVAFPNAFANTPLCCPSRTTMLTGRYAHNHGVLTNAVIGRTLFDSSTTIERYLHDAGYSTAFFGKLLNFWKVRNDPPFFDRWAVISPKSAANGGYRGPPGTSGER